MLLVHSEKNRIVIMNPQTTFAEIRRLITTAKTEAAAEQLLAFLEQAAEVVARPVTAAAAAARVVLWHMRYPRRRQADRHYHSSPFEYCVLVIP